ncbi:MAG: DUF2807 domain-containing protein [Burkholderiaceae bacterium]|nr:DUF2807 domain-containing protein [Burkholderiaceae bacterium]
MKKLLVLSVLLISGLAFADEQSRNVSSFSAIRTKSALNLIVEVGKEQSIKVNGDAKFQDSVTTEVQDGELLITSKRKNGFQINDREQVIVTVPTLKIFRMEGVGTTELRQISGDHFELYYEGAGLMTVQGKVKHFKLRAKGVGMVDAKALLAEEADISLEGVGAAKVYASEKLRAELQGIGSLNYYGNPRSVKKNVSGIGSVTAGD